jgi:hypothetical protein
MLTTAHIGSDTFDLGADPENGAVAPGYVSHLRNPSGYAPQTWNEAMSQMLDMRTIMGTLLGHTHPCVVAYGRFLRRYIRMLTRLEFETDHTHGWCLPPSSMTFHVHLAWRNWMVVQLESSKMEAIDPPDFDAGLAMLETQNNLMLIPSMTNMYLLLNPSLTPCPATGQTPAPAPEPAAAWISTPTGGILPWRHDHAATKVACHQTLSRRHVYRQHTVCSECACSPCEGGHTSDR